MKHDSPVTPVRVPSSRGRFLGLAMSGLSIALSVSAWAGFETKGRPGARETAMDASTAVAPGRSWPQFDGRWRYAKLDRFEVLTDLPDKESHRWIEQAALAIRVNQDILVPLLGQKPVGTISLILCRDQKSFDFLGRDGVYSSGSNSVLLSEDRFIRVLNVGRIKERSYYSPTAATWYVSGLGSYYLADEARFYPALPPWLSRAMQALVQHTVRNTGSRLAVGTLGPESSINMAFGSFRLMRRPHFVLEESLTSSAFAPTSAEAPTSLYVPVRYPTSKQEHEQQRDVFYFTHYALFKDEGRYQQAFLRFVAGFNHHESPKAWFEECFGMSMEAMNQELYRYRYGLVHLRTYRGFAEDKEAFTLRAATPTEWVRVMGEALALSRPHPAQKVNARDLLESPFARTSEDPDLLAARALFAYGSPEKTEARALLEAAMQAQVNRPLLYTALAELRRDHVGAQAPARGFTAEETTFVLEPLRTVLQRAQPPPQAYLLYADIWERSTATPSVEDVECLWEGAAHYQYDCQLVQNAIKLTDRSGLPVKILNGSLLPPCGDPDVEAWWKEKLDQSRLRGGGEQAATGPSTARGVVHAGFDGANGEIALATLR